MDRASLPKSITGISHSGFYVQDLDRTLDFYTKVLGARLEWRNDKSQNPLMKLYIGDFGLSIIKWPPDVPKFDIPHAIHWAYTAAIRCAGRSRRSPLRCSRGGFGPIAFRRRAAIWISREQPCRRKKIN